VFSRQIEVAGEIKIVAGEMHAACRVLESRSGSGEGMGGVSPPIGGGTGGLPRKILKI